MVPTRFAWPYGGHQVYLSGSFTGWTEHLLMTPVEGSSTVFQKICNLAPGYYQYKFLVDGVWRLDEQLPMVTDDYGIVNNFILVKEPDLIPPVLCTEASSPKSIMDVDNGIFRQPVSLLGGTRREVLAKIPDGEIDAFRHRLSVLLLTYTAYELLPESGKVIEFDANLPVQQAFRIMYEQGLAIVPIRDDHNGQFSAMLSASDFILILTELHKNGSMLTKEELEMHSISAWKEGKSQLIGEADRPVNQPFRRPLAQASPNDSLKEVALRILQNKISTIPIIHSPQDGSYPQLLHLASLPGILWHICRHVRHSPGSLPLLQNPVGRLPLGTWMHGNGGSNMCRLAVLPHNAPLSSALTLLIQDQVSSIPVVDDNGSLLDVYSRSDITSLAKGSAYAHIRLDQTSMNQALQLVYEANGGINIHKRCRTCLSSDSLHEVMERLSDPVVRRLIVVEAGSKRVEGIISLRDVFKFLLA